MNQILSVEMPKRKSGYYKRNSNKADIKTIIIFFTIILILFAAIIIAVGLSIKNKKNEPNQQQPNQNPVIIDLQPKINFELGDTIVNIIVTHDKPISYIAYDWNGGEKNEWTESSRRNNWGG